MKLPDTKDNSAEACAQRLVDYFTEYAKLQRRGLGDVSNSDSDSEGEEEMTSRCMDGNTAEDYVTDDSLMDEKKESAPQYIDITKQVVFGIYSKLFSISIYSV